MGRRVSELVSVGTSATKVLSTNYAKLKKVWAYNSSDSDITFYFCDSGGSQKTPTIKVLARQMLLIDEYELPEYLFETDIYAIASATGLQLMIEVEES